MSTIRGRLSSIRDQKLAAAPSSLSLSSSGSYHSAQESSSSHQLAQESTHNVVVVYNTPNPVIIDHMKEITNEQQRLVEHVDTMRRRMNDIESGVDQTQFLAIQKQLSVGETVAPVTQEQPPISTSMLENLEILEHDFNSKLDDLLHEIDQLKAANNPHSHSILGSSVEQLRKQLDKLELTVRQHVKTTPSSEVDAIGALKESHTNVKEELTKVAQKVAEVAQEGRVTQESVDLLKQNIASVLDTVNESKQATQESVDLLKQNIASVLDTVNESKQATQESVESQVNKTRSDIALDISNVDTKIQSSRNDLITEWKSKVEDFNQFKTDVLFSVDALKAMVDDVHVLKASVDNVYSRINDTQASVTTLQSDVQSSAVKVHLRIDDNHANLSNRISDVQTSIAEVKALADETRFAMNDTRVAVAGVSSDVQALVADVKVSVENAHSRIDDTRVTVATLLSDIETSVDETRGTIATLSTDVHASVANVKASVDETRGTIATLSTDVHASVANVKASVDNAHYRIDDTRMTVATLLSDVQTSINEVHALVDETRLKLDQDHKIEKVESQLKSLSIEFDVLIQERSQTESYIEVIKFNVSGLQEEHEMLKCQQESLLAKIQPIREEIVGIEEKINKMKSEFSVKSEQFQQKNAIQTFEIQDVRAQLEGAKDEQCKIMKQNMNLSKLCESIENEYKSISANFKQQYDTLQKRYQQLHTIMVSNMEETERGNQSVRELIEVHTRIEKDYKDVTTSYEQQQNEYQESLKERDARLKLLEDQVKQQLDSVDSRLVTLQHSSEQGVGGVGGVNSRARLSSRLEELAQPRQITQKKASSS
jgi:chromosome segregation ATPase